MPYNPFDKPIKAPLEADDLNTLITNSVAEGYFVEYKSVLPKAEKIAKSIASFANTYGGWYIVGVETNEHNVATKILGFSLADYKDPIASLRDAVRVRIDPVPLFFSQIVTLADTRVVLVAYIPGEQNTPFITSNGETDLRDAGSPHGMRNEMHSSSEVARGLCFSHSCFSHTSRTSLLLSASKQWNRDVCESASYSIISHLRKKKAETSHEKSRNHSLRRRSLSI